MKILFRMFSFVIIGYLVSFVVVTVVRVAVTQPLPLDVYADADRGDRASILRVAIEGEKFTSISNFILWPLALGTAYGLERAWRTLRRQQAKRSPGWLRWLGAIIAGLIMAIWVYSAYTLWVIVTLPEQYLTRPAAYSGELADLAQQLESTRGTVSLIAWIVATVLFGMLSKSTNEQPVVSLGQQKSRLSSNMN